MSGRFQILRPRPGATTPFWRSCWVAACAPDGAGFSGSPRLGHRAREPQGVGRHHREREPDTLGRYPRLGEGSHRDLAGRRQAKDGTIFRAARKEMARSGPRVFRLSVRIRVGLSHLSRFARCRQDHAFDYPAAARHLLAEEQAYFAFREQGHVLRSRFLLEYLTDVDLGWLIQSATNKNERFNQFVQRVAFRRRSRRAAQVHQVQPSRS
jgi:hypothetical protein